MQSCYLAIYLTKVQLVVKTKRNKLSETILYVASSIKSLIQILWWEYIFKSGFIKQKNNCKMNILCPALQKNKRNKNDSQTKRNVHATQDLLLKFLDCSQSWPKSKKWSCKEHSRRRGWRRPSNRNCIEISSPYENRNGLVLLLLWRENRFEY